MFYFFQRGTEFIRCAIEGSPTIGFTITITEPEGQERRETFETAEAVHARWLELQRRFTTEGWWGPLGRE